MALRPLCAPARRRRTRRVIRPAARRPTARTRPACWSARRCTSRGSSDCLGPAPTPAAMDAQARQAMDGVGAVLKAAGPRLRAPREVPRLSGQHGRLRGHERGVRVVLHRPRARRGRRCRRRRCRRGAGVQIACIGYADLAGISVVRPPAGSLPAPLGPYSPAVWAGDTLYVSGMGGQDPATKTVGESVEAQVTQTMANITTTLKAAGLRPADVVWAQAYATRVDEADGARRGADRGAWQRRVAAARPGRVPRLPGPIRAELTFVAAKTVSARPAIQPGRVPANAARGARTGNTVYVDAVASPGPRCRRGGRGAGRRSRGSGSWCSRAACRCATSRW